MRVGTVPKHSPSLNLLEGGSGVPEALESSFLASEEDPEYLPNTPIIIKIEGKIKTFQLSVLDLKWTGRKKKSFLKMICVRISVAT